MSHGLEPCGQFESLKWWGISACRGGGGLFTLIPNPDFAFLLLILMSLVLITAFFDILATVNWVIFVLVMFSCNMVLTTKECVAGTHITVWGLLFLVDALRSNFNAGMRQLPGVM